MYDPFVAMVVGVPEEHFSDDDDICLAAGTYVCGILESQLVADRHTIPNWVSGGCDEDWGVYFESQLADETFDFTICFFPDLSADGAQQMMVQYYLKVPFLKRLFRRPGDLAADHPLHETMRRFGRRFSSSRQLTRTEFEREY